MTKSEILKFYKGKKVLITGHTGFKGSWLTKILCDAKADVVGYSLTPPTDPSLFQIAGIERQMQKSVIADIRDYTQLTKIFDEFQPEIVLHLAAQPIVRTSYIEPRLTFETNVMGTVNVCEAVRLHKSVHSFVNVTTDKVYKNKEWCWGYRENEPLDGYDPYSNSKSCSELVTHSYINSFYNTAGVAVSTARAGNVIGGGDFAADRIIPDCVRSILFKKALIIRNPSSTRPYQHVLEPLFLYLTIAAEQYNDHEKAGFYNVGPDDCDCVTTGELVQFFATYFGKGFSAEIAKIDPNAPHEANFLKLDTSLVKRTFGWKPTWHIDEAVNKTVEWTKEWMTNPSQSNINMIMEKQIKEFTELHV